MNLFFDISIYAKTIIKVIIKIKKYINILTIKS